MDLERICVALDIPTSILSRELFPDYKYPKHALRYVAKSKEGLSSKQMAALVQFTGLPETELRLLSATPVEPTTTRNGWSWKPEADKSVFHKSPYRVDYHSLTNTAYLYKDAELISDCVLVAQTISLKQFLADMESLIATSVANKNR